MWPRHRVCLRGFFLSGNILCQSSELKPSDRKTAYSKNKAWVKIYFENFEPRANISALRSVSQSVSKQQDGTPPSPVPTPAMNLPFVQFRFHFDAECSAISSPLSCFSCAFDNILAFSPVVELVEVSSSPLMSGIFRLRRRESDVRLFREGIGLTLTYA